MGREWISLWPGTAISQPVNLTARTYNASLRTMQWMDNLADVTLLVTIGVQQISLTPQNLSSVVSDTGVPKMTFAGFMVATADTVTLRIKVPQLNLINYEGAYSGVWLDNVVLTKAAVNAVPSVDVTYPSNGQASTAKSPGTVHQCSPSRYFLPSIRFDSQ